MNNEKIIKDIEEIIMTNRIAKQLATTEMEKDSFRKSNDVLARAKTVIKNSEKDNYEKGLNDAWELAQRIGGPVEYGGYTPRELHDMFDTCSQAMIINNFSYQEALATVQEYEKKKEEVKLVPGDVVDVLGVYNAKNKYHGIFIKYNDNNDVVILTRSYGSTTFINSDNAWEITKTGEHIDISELIGVLYE